jgi:hypothetical protein
MPKGKGKAVLGNNVMGRDVRYSEILRDVLGDILGDNRAGIGEIC